MKLYDYIFYRIFKATNITNKSIPEWSTIISMSLILFINIFSVLLFVDYPIEQIGENRFKYSSILIILVHYMIFLRNKRYVKIIDKYDNSTRKANIYHDIIIMIYASISVFIFFKLIKIEIKYSILIILFMVGYSLFVYLFGKKD